MLINFKSAAAHDIYHGISSNHARKIPLNLHAKIRRLFDQLENANDIKDLAVPPGNRLERLRGNYAGKWSIRINDQWRIIFEWHNTFASNVDIIDYH